MEAIIPGKVCSMITFTLDGLPLNRSQAFRFNSTHVPQNSSLLLLDLDLQIHTNIKHVENYICLILNKELFNFLLLVVATEITLAPGFFSYASLSLSLSTV